MFWDIFSKRDNLHGFILAFLKKSSLEKRKQEFGPSADNSLKEVNLIMMGGKNDSSFRVIHLSQ